MFIDERYIKIKSMIPFLNINEITATTDILIKSDGGNEAIKVIDLENNYDRYKELLDLILSKVNKKASEKSQTAQEIMNNIRENRINKYKEDVDKKDRPALGGFLKCFNVMAYLMVISSLFLAIGLFAGVDQSRTAYSANQIILFVYQGVVGLFTIILLKKRKNSVKYALAAQPILGLVLTVVRFVQGINLGYDLPTLAFGAISLISTIVTTWFMIKIYFDYFDNFERSINTLVN